MKGFVIFIFVIMGFSLFANPFREISKDHWAYRSIKDLVDKGVIKGVAPDKFNGNKNITRYEIAIMVARLLDSVSKDSSEQVSVEVLEKLIKEMADELALIGVRVTGINDDINIIKKNILPVNSKVSDRNNISFSGDLLMTFGIREYEADEIINQTQIAGINQYGRPHYAGNDWENEFKIGLAVHADIDADISGFLRIRGLGTVGTGTDNDDNLWSVMGLVCFDDPRVPNLIDMTLAVEYAYIDIKNLFNFTDVRLGRQNLTFGNNLVYGAPTDSMSFNKIIDRVNFGLNFWDSDLSYFDIYKTNADNYSGHNVNIPDSQKYKSGFDSFALSLGVDFGGHNLGAYYINQTYDYYDPYLRVGDSYAVKYGRNNTGINSGQGNVVSAGADFSAVDYLSLTDVQLPSADPQWLALTLNGNFMKDLDYFMEFIHYDSDLDPYTTNYLPNAERTINGVSVKLPGRELNGNAWVLGVDWDFSSTWNFILQYGEGDEEFVPSTIDQRQTLNGMMGRFSMQSSRNKRYWAPTGSLQGVKDLLVKLGKDISDKTNLGFSYEKCRENDTSKYIGIVETDNFVYGTAVNGIRTVEKPTDYSAFTISLAHQYKENTSFSLIYQTINYDQDMVNPDGVANNGDEILMDLSANAGGWQTLKGGVEVKF